MQLHQLIIFFELISDLPFLFFLVLDFDFGFGSGSLSLLDISYLFDPKNMLLKLQECI